MPKDFQEIDCLYCSSAKKTQITSIGQFSIPTNVVICKDCGFMYLSPRWTSERYNDFYSYEYEKFYPRQSTTVTNDFKLGKLISKRVNTFYPLAHFKNVLDIGSGFGDILLYLKEYEYKDADYFAIEPSKVCIDFLEKEKIKVIAESVDSDWDADSLQKFDLIIMRHVLEHFLDPLPALKKVANALSEDGLAYIAVPDAYHPISPLNDYYFRTVHISYFNKDTIAGFLQKAGLVLHELQDNKNGELFLIAKKVPTPGAVTIFNVYSKQLKIIEEMYAKERLAALPVQKQTDNTVISFLRKVKHKIFP